EVRLGPRCDMQMAAFLGELPGAGQANSLGSTGDEGGLAAQVQIHAGEPSTPVIPTGARSAEWRDLFCFSHREEKVPRLRRPSGGFARDDDHVGSTRTVWGT